MAFTNPSNGPAGDWDDVSQQARAGGGAIGHPGLVSMNAVICVEENPALEQNRCRKVIPFGASRPGVDVRDQSRPQAVPSLCQSSKPWTPSSAARYSCPFRTLAQEWYSDHPSAGPGLMSPTSLVPAVVPSLLQSSWPWTPSSAVKKSVPAISATGCGCESPGPGMTSLTKTASVAAPAGAAAIASATRAPAAQRHPCLALREITWPR